MKPILLRILQSVLFIMVTVWLALAILIYFFQARLVFYPSRTLGQTPADINLDYEEVFLQGQDAVEIHGWWLPAENGRATLLFLHGNAGNISHRLDSLKIFHDLGLATLIIDYRGYGKSRGKPSEPGTYLDAMAAWRYLTEDRDIEPQQIIIFGRSLGGAVAVWLAANTPAAGLIMESTFTSIVDIGRQHYPYLPVKYLARIHYPSIDLIARINSPLLVIHSPEDEIIPYRLGQALYDQAGEPRYFLEISGAHNGGFLESGRRYTQGLDAFIETVMARESG